MNLFKRPVLLLNASLEPLRIITAKRALTMLTKGKVIVVIPTNLQAVPGVYIPSVVKLVNYVYVQSRRQQVSKKNIHLRDDYTCLYCNKTYASADLTLDHVFPRSRGGKNTWENLVTACQPCNRRKDDRTPEEAGMPLRRNIVPSTVHTAKSLLRSMGKGIPEWSKYLYVDSIGDQKFVTYG